MSNEYSREILRRVVAQVCQIIGWQGINSTPLDILVHILEKYILTLCTQTQRYAEQFNRSEANLHDLGLVFRDIHIPLQELREYTRCVPPAPSQLTVPSFPLPKDSHLNFLKPGSQEVLTRPVHVHEYLPAMYPEKESDISPPVADTIEIVQNGIDRHGDECGSPEISVTEDPDKGKDVFKRPVDPVSLTPPGAKRPRLKLEEEDSRTREISSVMMTMSGFLSPAREGKLPEARTPIVVHDQQPEKPKNAAPHTPVSSHRPPMPHRKLEHSEKKSKKNKALNGKIEKVKKKDKGHKNMAMGSKPKNSENRINKLAMHLARGKVRPSSSVKQHTSEMPPLKQLPPSLENNLKPIKQEVIDKPSMKMPPMPLEPLLPPPLPPPLTQMRRNPLNMRHDPDLAIGEPPPPLPPVFIKEERLDVGEKLTSQPDRSKLNIFKKISTKIKEEKNHDIQHHDRFMYDNGAVKSEKPHNYLPTHAADDNELNRQKMLHVSESIDFVVNNSAVDLSSKKSLIADEVIDLDDEFDVKKRVFKQEVLDDLPKDLSKPKLVTPPVGLSPSPMVKEKKERKHRERKPKVDKATKEFTKMMRKQQLAQEKLRNFQGHDKIPSALPPVFPMFPALVPNRGHIPGSGIIPGPGLIPSGSLFSGLTNNPVLRGMIPPDPSNLLPNPFSLGSGGAVPFSRPDFLHTGPGLIPPNITNPLLSHLSHSFGKPPRMPQHPPLPPFLRRPSLEVIPIDDDNQMHSKNKHQYLSPPLVIKEKERHDKSKPSNNNMILNNINPIRTSPIKQSPPKVNPSLKMPPVKPDVTIKLNPPDKPKHVETHRPEPVSAPSEPPPVLPLKDKEKDKFERKKDKLHKKEKKDKEQKVKKKKDKKDKLKIKIEKKRDKEEKQELKEKLKREKKEKRKEKEKEKIPPTPIEGLVPKLTLKLGPPSPMLPASPDNPRKLNIKPVVRKDEATPPPPPPPVEPPTLLCEERLSAERSQSPELARISALVTRPPKSKSTKHGTPSVKMETNSELNRSLSPPVQTSNTSPSRKIRPPSTFSKYKRIYFKPIPKRNSLDDSVIDIDADEISAPPKDVVPTPDKVPNVPLGTPYYMDPQGNKVWICPACGMPDNGSPMIGCDGGCDGWYHWVCVGIRVAPSDTEDWYCMSCIAKRTAMASALAAGQTGKKRGRKPKSEKLKEIH